MSFTEMTDLVNTTSGRSIDDYFIAISSMSNRKEEIFKIIRAGLHVQIKPSANRNEYLTSGRKEQYQYVGRPIQAWAVRRESRSQTCDELEKRGIYDTILEKIPEFKTPIAATNPPTVTWPR